MGAVYTQILRDEGIILEERKKVGGAEVEKDRDEDIELVVPPVFENCTRVLDAKEQVTYLVIMSCLALFIKKTFSTTVL